MPGACAREHGTARLSVILGGQASNNSAALSYYEVGGITPEYGPLYGTTRVQIKGRGYEDWGYRSLAFVHNRTTVSTQNCTVHNASTIVLTTSAVDLPSEETIRATPTISLNYGATWTAGTRPYSFYRRPQIDRIVPAFGALSGGTLVEVHGRNILNTTRVRGRMSFANGTTYTSCERRSTRLVVCIRLRT